MVVLGHGVCAVTQNGRQVVKDETLPVRRTVTCDGHEHAQLSFGGRNGDGGTDEMWMKIAFVLMLYFVLT